MVLIDMLEESKNKKRLSTGQLLHSIFKNNWEEKFLFDGINNKSFSYEEFFTLTLQYKEKLQETGLQKNDQICLLIPNSVNLIALYFASLMMQIVVIPIDPTKNKNEINEILSYVKCRSVICNVSNHEFIPNSIDLSNFNNLIQKNDIDINKLDIFIKLDYDSLFLITFTSGTTGIPKGVMHSFNNLVLSASAFNKKFNFNKKNIFYHNLPMSYMAGILNLIVLPFISESKIVLGERFNISNMLTFWDIPIKYNVNTFWFIPTILALLLKLDRGTKGVNYTNNIEVIGCVGTAPLNHITKTTIEKKYNISLYESYGLSETLFVTTNFPRNNNEYGVGQLLDGAELTFCSDDEILINVPWMFLGYANQAKNQFFKNGKYTSGDIGEITQNGFLTITGRKKDLIIKGGINISPKKIENFINEYNVFNENVILGIEDPYLGEKTICFFVPKEYPYDENMNKTLNLQIITQLGKDYGIDQFVEIEQIPKNSNGKVDNSKIREMYKMKTNANRN
jgi:long-chain acyl-CoA synthetase